MGGPASPRLHGVRLPLRRLLPRRITRQVTRHQPTARPAAASWPGAGPARPAQVTGPHPTGISPAAPETGWDQLTAQAAPARPAEPVTEPVAGPPLLNYVRIPVAFSLLLLMLFFPLILGLSQPEYHRTSGLSTRPYLWRWLAIAGVMFAISAIAYAWRLRRLARKPEMSGTEGDSSSGAGPPVRAGE